MSFSSLHEVSRSCKSSFSDTRIKVPKQIWQSKKEERPFYLKINSTLCWPLCFKWPVEAQWHKPFQILLKISTELSKTSRNFFPLNNLEHRCSFDKKSFSSQCLKLIPKLWASFVFTKYKGKPLLRLKHTLIKIEANYHQE